MILSNISSNDVMEAIHVGKHLLETALSGENKDTVVMIRVDHLSILTALSAMWVSKT